MSTQPTFFNSCFNSNTMLFFSVSTTGIVVGGIFAYFGLGYGSLSSLTFICSFAGGTGLALASSLVFIGMILYIFISHYRGISSDISSTTEEQEEDLQSGSSKDTESISNDEEVVKPTLPVSVATTTTALQETSRKIQILTEILERAQMPGFKANVLGIVYIDCLSSGPIRHDRRFGFSQRLQTEDRQPMIIADDDIYLRLDGVIKDLHGDKEIHFLDKNGHPTSGVYFPASLFNGVKEGEAFVSIMTICL